MARSLYGGRLGDQVFAPFEPGRFLRLPVDATGAPTSTVLTVWDEPDGTLLDNLLTYPGLAVIDEVVVPATGQIPAFMGPDGYNDGLWLRAPDGAYYRLDAKGEAGPTGPAGPAGADGLGTVNSVNGQSPDGAGAVTVPASAVGSTAVGGISATDVQAALAELDAEKQRIDTYVSGLATTGTVTVDATNGEGVYASATLTGNITITPTNVPATGPFIFEYRSVQHASAAKTVTVPTQPMNETSATFTPTVAKAFSVFFEYLNGANLRIWTSVAK